MVGFTEPRQHTGAHKCPRMQFLNSPSSCGSLIQQQRVSTHASIRNIQFLAQLKYNSRPRSIQKFNAKSSDLNFRILKPAVLRVSAFEAKLSIIVCSCHQGKDQGLGLKTCSFKGTGVLIVCAECLRIQQDNYSHVQHSSCIEKWDFKHKVNKIQRMKPHSLTLNRMIRVLSRMFSHCLLSEAYSLV
jgi:hypothetical protein